MNGGKEKKVILSDFGIRYWRGESADADGTTSSTATSSLLLGGNRVCLRLDLI